jgi:hypothetical protein
MRKCLELATGGHNAPEKALVQRIVRDVQSKSRWRED